MLLPNADIHGSGRSAVNDMIQQAKPSERELEDLILLALAKREQMSAEETLQPLPKPEESQRFTGNIRRIAEFEGWIVIQMRLMQRSSG